MAIAFSSGSYTGQIDLLTQLDTFLSGGGTPNWTVDFFGADAIQAGETRLTGNLNSGAMRFTIISQITSPARPRMLMTPHTGLNTGIAYDNQPGGPLAAQSDGQVQAISTDSTVADGGGGSSTNVGNFWFFADADYLIVVLEPAQASGFFQSFFWGRLNVFTGVSNGYMCHGAVSDNDQNQARGDWNSTANTGAGSDLPNQACFIGVYGTGDTVGHLYDHSAVWKRISDGNVVTDAGVAWGSWDAGRGGNKALTGFFAYQYIWTASVSNIVPVLSPGLFFTPHSTLAPKKAPIGVVPGAFFVSIKQTGGEAQSLLIGPDEYLLFPAIRSKRLIHNLRFAGIAVQKV